MINRRAGVSHVHSNTITSSHSSSYYTSVGELVVCQARGEENVWPAFMRLFCSLKKSLFQSQKAIGDKPITHWLLWLGRKLVFLSSANGRAVPGEVLKSLLGKVSGLITQLCWSLLLKRICASLFSFTVQPLPISLWDSHLHILSSSS